MKVRDAVFVGLIITTLFIKELWKLVPYSEQTFKMFPYSDTLITKQTYFWFWCFYGIQIIIVSSWWYKFEDYRTIFTAWFIFQVLEFIEFYFTYNEALIWFYVGEHTEGRKIGLNVIKFKYVTVAGLTIKKIYKQIKTWSQ